MSLGDLILLGFGCVLLGAALILDRLLRRSLQHERLDLRHGNSGTYEGNE